VLRRFVLSAAFLTACSVLSATQPDPLLNPAAPEFAEPAPARFFVTFTTNKGGMVLDVERRLAPNGVDRFHALVRHGFYDGARFFRVVRPRFVQFGIPGNPAVAQAWRERTIPDDPRLASNVRGAVSFAFAVPNGRTTQLFVNLRNNSADFDKEPFVPFAHVIDGMDVADKLNGEYGENAGGGIRAGKQDPVFTGGNAFFEQHFPRLDYIVRATILSL
jgi:homoserine O-acetyltransferase